MQTVRVFQNSQFGSIRIIDNDGEPWFIGKDIANALGYSNTKDALNNHVDEEDKRIIKRSQITTFNIPQRSGTDTFTIPARGLTIINESGLYSLVLQSKLPAAKPFKRWVTHEVLPSIRKTGQYISPKSTQPEKPKAKEQSPNREYMVSLAEVLEAHRVFTEYVAQRISDTELPPKAPSYMSKEILLQCALAEVWKQGKLWHKNHEEKTPVQKLLGANFENVLA